ncbi:helix-turn-helix domain-containing protein [Stackebrandtia soli]|uniref:helix-turn-helix domain-containing protein n=1 Tax=Stackebrandtia soli TaxID=1892856 RepID=UPI0039E96557
MTENPTDPTADHVRANIERLRKARGLSYQALSDRLETMGRPIPPLGLSRIEKGTRRVDVGDLVALAQIFDLSPAALLLPPHDDGDPVDITGGPSVPWRTAWRWNSGEHPLFAPDEEGDPRADPEWPERLRRYIRASRPHEAADIVDEIARFLSSRLAGSWRLEIDRDHTGRTRAHLTKESTPTPE